MVKLTDLLFWEKGGLILILVSLLLTLLINTKLCNRPKVKLHNEIMSLDEREMMDINHIGLFDLINELFKSEIDNNIINLNEVVGIRVNKGYSMGQFQGSFQLLKSRSLNETKDFVPISRPCGFSEIKAWSNNDSALKWIGWIIGVFGLAIQIIVFILKPK